MKKQTTLLFLFVLLIGIITAHNSLHFDAEPNLKQQINASLLIDSTCIDRSKVNYQACPQVYQPVCGCDGRTYWTACHAQREGVISWAVGSCHEREKHQVRIP